MEYEILLKSRKEEKIMDIIDIKLMSEKDYLELTTMEMESWREKRKHAKECYVNTLKIKRLKDTNPEQYAKIVEHLEKEEKSFEDTMLDMEVPYHERMMKKIRAGEEI